MIKLGAENRKQVITLAILGGIAVLILAYEFWPSSSTATHATTAAPTTAKPATRRTKSGKVVPVIEPRLDPTLDLKQLNQSEEIKYAGNGRNIFVAGSVPIEVPKGNGTTGPKEVAAIRPGASNSATTPDHAQVFLVLPTGPAKPRGFFLSQGEDIFIAAEGDIVDRRYRVLHITPTAVDVEDVLNNNRQSLPLTQG